jgi:predicted secreted protein
VQYGLLILRKSSGRTISKMLLGIVIVIIVIIAGGVIYYATLQFTRTGGSSSVSTSAPLPVAGTLRIEEAQLAINESSCSPSPCGLNVGSFAFIIRNTGELGISGLKVDLGNITMLSNSSLPPGQVYADSIPVSAFPVCSYQPLTIGGTLSNQTSFVLKDRVLATSENDTTTCSDQPLAVSMNQVVVPVNATNLSAWPGNMVWSIAAKNAGSQPVTTAYATLLMTGPTDTNGTGYQSVTVGLAGASPGGNESSTTSAFVNSECCTEATFHVELANGTALDFATSPQVVEQPYYKTFVTGQPDEGALLIRYVFPNSTAPVNVTSVLTVTNLSSPSGGTHGIFIVANPASVSAKPGSVTSINMSIGDTEDAEQGVYLIAYPLDVCPGIIVIIGTPPSTIPQLPPQPGCLDSQTIPESQQVQSLSGFTTAYLPEEIVGK